MKPLWIFLAIVSVGFADDYDRLDGQKKPAKKVEAAKAPELDSKRIEFVNSKTGDRKVYEVKQIDARLTDGSLLELSKSDRDTALEKIKADAVKTGKLVSTDKISVDEYDNAMSEEQCCWWRRGYYGGGYGYGYGGYGYGGGYAYNGGYGYGYQSAFVGGCGYGGCGYGYACATPYYSSYAVYNGGFSGWGGYGYGYRVSAVSYYPSVWF